MEISMKTIDELIEEGYLAKKQCIKDGYGENI